MPPSLTARQVLDAEYRAASRVRSLPPPKRPASTLAARAVRQVGGNTHPNRLAWLQIALFLLDRKVCP